MIAAIPPVWLNAKLGLPALVLLPLSGMAYMALYTALVLLFGSLGKDEIAAIKRTASLTVAAVYDRRYS